MSLILEALKKSEAERRLGRTPDLLTPSATREPERRPWLWLWGAVFGLAAALAVVLALWARSALQQPAVPSTVATSPMPLAHDPEPPVVTPTPSATMPARATAAPARTPEDVIANVPVPQDPDFSGTERESMPVPASAIPLPTPAPSTPSDALPTSRAAATPRMPSESLPQAPAPEPVPVAAPITSAPASIPAPAPAAAPAPEPAPEPEPALEPIQHLSTLPASHREGLPPLRLSMHVYDPDPAARFVLIDGKRYRQGDTIAAGIVLDAIRPDGVAIARGGQRFLISRP